MKQHWNVVCRWCLGAALALGLGCAAAQDLVSERAYFEDPSGKMELAQVIAHAPRRNFGGIEKHFAPLPERSCGGGGLEIGCLALSLNVNART